LTQQLLEILMLQRNSAKYLEGNRNYQAHEDASARKWAEINHVPQPLAEFMAALETMTADKGERE
jgi:hypothetical protein